MLHREQGNWGGTLHINEEAHLTSKDILRAIASGSGLKHYRIALGCSSWSAGQLEEELRINSWLTVEASPELIFDVPATELYTQALAKLGVSIEFYAPRQAMPETIPATLLRLMAFDFGTKRIGIAVGQRLTATAEPLNPIKAQDGIPNWDELWLHYRAMAADALLVGLPLNMDGSPSQMSVRANKFAKRLEGRYHRRVLPTTSVYRATKPRVMLWLRVAVVILANIPLMVWLPSWCLKAGWPNTHLHKGCV